MAKLSIGDLDLAGKRVFVRVDFNVPMDGTRITDDTRIRAALPTIQALLDKGASLVIAAHLGRPKGHDPKLSMKPVAERLDRAMDLARLAADAGVRNGVVQDKLFLPGIAKLRRLLDGGFFGRVLSVRGEFGYWVFEGDWQEAQRPSWNYRKGEGGGIMVDMLCHWRYVIDNLFGRVRSISCLGATHIGKRWDETGTPFEVDTDDAAYATLETDTGVVCQFNSSWTTRVRRDDLLTLHVDGEKGSAVAGLTQCWIQSASETPRYVWNPDLGRALSYERDWAVFEKEAPYGNAFKAEWELFLKHVVSDEPFRWNLLEGAKGVQLAELGLEPLGYFAGWAAAGCHPATMGIGPVPAIQKALAEDRCVTFRRLPPISVL